MDELLERIRKCTECSAFLKLGPRPIVTAHPLSRIAIIGQAPGLRVHTTGIPWDDKSGENLRQWMGVDEQTFYDPKQIALIPMGFCYPGRGTSGDLPPRKECAPLWHHLLFEKLKNIELTILVGSYAQDQYLSSRKRATLTETVKNFEEYLPEFFVLPHSSPRNNIWQAKNPWFKANVVPRLEETVSRILG